MKTTGRLWLLFACACALAIAVPGCGGDETTPQDTIGADAGTDAMAVDIPVDAPQADHQGRDIDDAAAEADLGDSTDDSAVDVLLPDTEDDALADTAEEVIIDCPANFLCECEDANDCFSGFCVDTEIGRQCTKNCMDSQSCPDGWKCGQVLISGDSVYVCLPAFPGICKPCKADADCVPAMGAGDRVYKCLPHGEDGSFCGAECLDGRECPDGYECEDFGEGDDAYTQCVPEGGECPCREYFVNQGYETECTKTNDFGTCRGTRTCDTACNAPDAVQETCNNADDDCNGQIDDNVPPEECPLTNTIGTCTGYTVCTGGQKLCQGAYASTESCNDQDDDCDGIKDDGLGTTTCGVGACLHTIPNCEGGVEQTCDPMDGATAEVCDGIDNDCNGVNDNGFIDTNGDLEMDCVDDDDDGDTIPDIEDNCQLVKNTDQANLDADELGDACDPDRDGDDINDDVDNCPGKYNPAQADLNDNGIGDDCEDDLDNDGILNLEDNCPWIANPYQEDSDMDMWGDVCDCDIDGDGIYNTGWDFDNIACPAPTPVDNCTYAKNTDQANYDLDQWGDACDCDADADGAANAAWGCTGAAVDCAPLDPAVHPAAVEKCNNIDDNCAGGTDEGCDDDADDWCDKTMTVVGTPTVCPNGGGDCNDDEFGVNPGIAEICNGIDDNCAGGVDNGLGSTTCGLGQCLHTIANCIGGEPQTCNPLQGQTPEICDDVDNDCDGAVDEGCDSDNDDYCDKTMTVSGTPSACPKGNNDCNDDNPDINPGASESCNNTDDNCDGTKDEGLGSTTCGVGQCVHTINNCVGGVTQTCNPMQGASTEICDGIDNNCLGDIDEGCDDDADDYCDKNMAMSGTPAVCPNGGGDCNDDNGQIKPGSLEKCDDIDNNCDSDTDLGCDDDNDNWCDANMTVVGTPSTCTNGGGDCADTVAARNPGVTEICNGIDDNCNGANDEGLGTITCGLGVCNHTIQACVGGEPQTCDPLQGASTEICDGLNNDCDADGVDEGCDDDGDDYCDKTMGTTGTPAVCPNGGGDCDDTASTINPGQTEACNNIDDNCNSVTDDGIASAVDGYESNNTCLTTRDLGTFTEDGAARVFTATIYPSADADFYVGYFEEAGGIDCFPFTDQDYRVKITLTPPSGSNCVDYRVYILTNDNTCTVLASNTTAGCGAKTVQYDWDGGCGADDSETYKFKVVPNSTNDWECVGYTMSVEMDSI